MAARPVQAGGRNSPRTRYFPIAEDDGAEEAGGKRHAIHHPPYRLLESGEIQLPRSITRAPSLRSFTGCRTTPIPSLSPSTLATPCIRNTGSGSSAGDFAASIPAILELSGQRSHAVRLPVHSKADHWAGRFPNHRVYVAA